MPLLGAAPLGDLAVGDAPFVVVPPAVLPIRQTLYARMATRYQPAFPAVFAPAAAGLPLFVGDLAGRLVFARPAIPIELVAKLQGALGPAVYISGATFNLRDTSGLDPFPQRRVDGDLEITATNVRPYRPPAASTVRQRLVGLVANAQYIATITIRLTNGQTETYLAPIVVGSPF